MGGILSLEPEGIEKRIHPRALEHFRKFQADARFEVPLEELNNDDLDRYLKDDEKPEFQRYMNRIKDGLRACVDIGDGDSLDNQAKLLLFEVHTIMPMFNIRQLLKKVYNRKVKSLREEQEKREEEERQRVAKAKEEQRRREEKAEAQRREREEKAEAQRREKEEEERWRAACKVVNPPIDDAKKYFTKPGEHDKYVKAALVAIEVYMEKGEEYVGDSRTFDYQWYLTEIDRRRAQEAQKAHAVSEVKKYNTYLNQEISRLRSKLEPKLKDLLSYFKLKIKDSRHTDHSFDYALSAEETNDFDSTLVSLANKKLEQFIPNDLRQFIDIPSQYYRIYIPLPSAIYNFEGIPCLDFSFDIFAAAYGEVWLKASQKEFNGYIFDLPVIEKPNGSALLEKPKFIGYHYLVLTPEDIGGYVPWESIPLVLVKGLMNGELQPTGTTVLAASEAETTYKIKGFEGEATIPDSFASYLKEIGGIDQMVNVGIISRKVANVVEKSLTQSETKERTPLLPDEQDTGYEDKDLLSSLAELGIPFKEAEILLPLIPKNLALPEAIKFALQKHMKS